LNLVAAERKVEFWLVTDTRPVSISSTADERPLHCGKSRRRLTEMHINIGAFSALLSTGGCCGGRPVAAWWPVKCRPAAGFSFSASTHAHAHAANQRVFISFMIFF
jgi:hypothetical protein